MRPRLPLSVLVLSLGTCTYDAGGVDRGPIVEEARVTRGDRHARAEREARVEPRAALDHPARPSPRAPAEVCAREPPDGFVSLPQHIPGIQLDIRYHRADNFTGTPLPGYGAPGAWLARAPADALAAVQAELAPRGLGLVIFDAYRPQRATRAMVTWDETHNHGAYLRGGYVARRSGHARGHTVDLGLVQLASGEPLDMGSDFDVFDRSSHTDAAEGEALRNRLLLRAVMRAHGFAPFAREWWHFRHAGASGLEARDIPYECDPPASPDAP